MRLFRGGSLAVYSSFLAFIDTLRPYIAINFAESDICAFVHHIAHRQFLSRVSTAMLTRDIDIAILSSVRPFVRLSVRLARFGIGAVSGSRVLYPNFLLDS